MFAPRTQPWHEYDSLALTADRGAASERLARWAELRVVVEATGEDSMVVARLLGHASTTMVERVCGDLDDDNHSNAASKLPALPAEPVVHRSSPRAPARPRRPAVPT